MMRTAFSAALLSSVSFIGSATAQQIEQVPPIEVTAKPGTPTVAAPDSQPAPMTSITREGLNLLGGPAQTSIYQAADVVPSVLYESPDPYGLSPQRNINIRGKTDFHLSKNVEGLPLMGIVGGADLFDLENVQRLDVYRSAMTADKLGLSTATGVIDQRLLGPQDKFGAFGRQAFGSYNFYKSFVRADTGLIKETNTKAFLSTSFAGADKWTGAGDQKRRNVTFGINQKLGDRINVDVYGVYSHYQGNTYRALSYAQTLDLKANYRYDYNKFLTGIPATDANYYGFNKSQYDNYAILAKIDYEIANGHHIIFKPYYWYDDGVSYSASGSNVQVWNQKNDNLGGVLQYEGHYGTGTDVLAGYWWQSLAPPPPPTDQKQYSVVNGSLQFAKWQTLARIDNFVVNSPFAQISQTYGSWFLTGGLRYINLGAPHMQYYDASKVGDMSLSAALSTNPPAVTGGEVAARDYGELLPNIGVRNDLNNIWSVALSYGRRFGRPDWGPQASNYASNLAKFQAIGVSLQNLVDYVKPELADQFDGSLRYKNGDWVVVPTLFYSKHRNKQVLVTDAAASNLSYYAGVGSTTEYGAELEVEYEITRKVSAFFAGTLVSETFDSDTPLLSGGTPLPTKGKQLPNAPTRMLKGGLTYHWDQFALTPIVRYVGQRFGDASNTTPVPGYTTVDLTASYDIGKVGPVSLTANLTVLNLFDRGYIAEISPNDTNLGAGANYYPGAPRTIVGSLTAKF